MCVGSPLPVSLTSSDPKSKPATHTSPNQIRPRTQAWHGRGRLLVISNPPQKRSSTEHAFVTFLSVIHTAGPSPFDPVLRHNSGSPTIYLVGFVTHTKDHTAEACLSLWLFTYGGSV